MNKNISKKCVVQNAENKKVVTLKDTKNQEKSSIFGITVEQLVSSYDFNNMKYETTLAEDIMNLCRKNGITSDGMFQQRSCVLALKLAEASLLKEMTDDEPLALLDDVMSELDESRQDYILNHIKNWQVFITCCDANTVLRLKKGKTFHIENGRCIG